MVDVRKGDRVVVHGRALLHGQTVSEGIVTGVGAGDQVSVKIPMGDGRDFDLPGVAKFGQTDDQSNWWEFPKDDDGKDILPVREAEDGPAPPVDEAPPAA